MGLHILVVGNPVDGLKFYGPFATRDEANEWGDTISREFDWWVAPLAESPEAV